ncbi:MAG: nucleotidyltransferase family protein, partial [Nitrospira sp.]|nr:nucleotidyltransferase family protein [Nitrospira sp.]
FEVELRRILTTFAAKNIPLMPLKGSVSSFLQPLYPSPAIRVLSDLDLLIMPRNREAAFACLVGLGYTPTKKIPLPGVERVFTQDGVLVDLHWKLLRIPRYAAADRLWQRAHPVECPGGAYYVPSLLDQFYVRFLHDTLQDHDLPTLPMGKAYEAFLLLQQVKAEGASALEALATEACQDGLGLVLGAYLAGIQDLFPSQSSLPPSLQQCVDEARRILRAATFPWPRQGILHFAIARDLLVRLRAGAWGSRRRAFIQTMWRESVLAEPVCVVSANPVSRLLHFCRLCAHHWILVIVRLLFTACPDKARSLIDNGAPDTD